MASDYDGTLDYEARARRDNAQPADLADLAECGVCGRNKRVCCDEGYTDNEDGTRTHVGAVCVDCCGPHGNIVWDGKCVAGGTYERTGVQE
jgi:hypothetical protein